MLKVNSCGQSMSVVPVRRAVSTIALKACSPYTPGPIDSKLGRKHFGDFVDKKIAKIVPIGNQRWPPWPPS